MTALLLLCGAVDQADGEIVRIELDQLHHGHRRTETGPHTAWLPSSALEEPITEGGRICLEVPEPTAAVAPAAHRTLPAPHRDMQLRQAPDMVVP